jgi:hypothetical protein
MFRTKVVGSSATSARARAGAWAVLALWCLLSIISGATRAHCLDLGEGCAPSSAGAAPPCHEQTPPGESDPRCGSCVDVVVPEVASARCSRPAVEVDAAVQALLPAGTREFALAEHAPRFSASHLGRSTPHPSVRTTVLLI